MGESTGVTRRVKPWVAIVVIAITAVIFGGAWMTVSGLRLSGRFGVRSDAAAPHGQEWNRANNLCRRLNMAGNSYAVSGMYDSALACYREALRIAKKHGLIERMAASYLDISNVYDGKNMPESVRFYLDAAAALNRNPDRKGQIASGLLEEGTFRFKSLGDVDSGSVLLEKALKEGRKRGNRWTEAVALFNLGQIQAARKNYDSAGVLYESSAAVSRVLHAREGEVSALHGRALLCLYRDRLDDAKSWLLQAIEAAHAGSLFGQEASALFDIACIRAEQGDRELARVNAEQALKLYQQILDNGGMNACRNLLAELEDADRSEYRAHIDSILEHCEEKPDFGM